MLFFLVWASSVPDVQSKDCRTVVCWYQFDPRGESVMTNYHMKQTCVQTESSPHLVNLQVAEVEPLRPRVESCCLISFFSSRSANINWYQDSNWSKMQVTDIHVTSNWPSQAESQQRALSLFSLYVNQKVNSTDTNWLQIWNKAISIKIYRNIIKNVHNPNNTEMDWTKNNSNCNKKKIPKAYEET